MADDPPTIPPITETEIDAVLYEAKGDAREAVRLLLHDLAVLGRMPTGWSPTALCEVVRRGRGSGGGPEVEAQHVAFEGD